MKIKTVTSVILSQAWIIDTASRTYDALGGVIFA